jgi:hypothetical protein
MKNAFGNYEIRNIETLLAGGAADRVILAAMETQCLTQYVLSDGCSYPIVRLIRTTKENIYQGHMYSPEASIYACLDPYQNYQGECEVTLAAEGHQLHDGCRFSVKGHGRELPKMNYVG